MALREVVLPLAVSPLMKRDILCSRQSQRYAAIDVLNVPHLINWIMVGGLSANFRIVNDAPPFDTSSL